ncbi:MAG: hypothetical protein EA397_19350 [Deltaproteobacteria bacterium]|nr:MAG: hypothetical protein EA397_19350 [Deltaproteobacteria bacterium]
MMDRPRARPARSGARPKGAARWLGAALWLVCVSSALAAPEEEPQLESPGTPPPTADEGPLPVLGATEGAPAKELPKADVEAEGLYVEFGRGVRLTNDDATFSLTIRGRVQARGSGAFQPMSPEPDLRFKVRRARLVFLGNLEERDLEVYIQLGFGADDLEPDWTIPLRDAVITWTPLRDLNLRVGQMKVNFNRERMISSSSLQLVDRSIVNAELNLDRDIGAQLFSNDLFGLDERLGYQIGVYGGDGRNRAVGGSGLMYVGRVQVNPFGGFKDLFMEADLARLPKPRLSIGVAGGLNYGTTRQRGTHGEVLDDAFNTRHAAVDMLFKISGFSLQAEALVREVEAVSGAAAIERSPLNAGGAFVQAGYVLPAGVEFSGRWAQVRPAGDHAEVSGRTELASGLGYYVQRHDLKIQTDYTIGWGLLGLEAREQADHRVRAQVQVFF